MSWTDERVEMLKALWAEGLSASQIAKQLGGVSRNAVIGKVHRLGLEGRGKSNQKKAEEAAPAPEAVATEPAKRTDEAPAQDAAPEPAPAARAMDEPANDPGEPAAEDAAADEDDVVVPIPRRLKLTELTERTCKWPIGDPMHDDFHFCGNEVDEGRPYCEYHSNIAFQPASERRRVR